MMRKTEATRALDDRIAEAFADGATSKGVAALIEETEAAAHVASEAAERSRTRAFDPSLTMLEVATTRGEMEDAAFNRDRLQAAMLRLKERLDQLRIAEENDRRRATYKKAKAERDALAAELEALYPSFAQKLADLLTRIEASNREIEILNANALPAGVEPLLLAELVARKMDGWTKDGLDAPRLTSSVRLPAFERTPHAPWLWPCSKPEQGVMIRELFALMEETKARTKATKSKAGAESSPTESAEAVESEVKVA